MSYSVFVLEHDDLSHSPPTFVLYMKVTYVLTLEESTPADVRLIRQGHVIDIYM